MFENIEYTYVDGVLKYSADSEYRFVKNPKGAMLVEIYYQNGVPVFWDIPEFFSNQNGDFESSKEGIIHEMIKSLIAINRPTIDDQDLPNLTLWQFRNAIMGKPA